MDMNIIATELHSYLPATLSVPQYTVGITDICLDRLHNIPKTTITVAVGDAIHSITIPSSYASSGVEIASLLTTHLESFANVDFNEELLSIQCKDEDTVISIPPKLSAILGLKGSIKGKNTGKPRLFNHLRRIYLCCDVVESSIAGNGFLPVLYYGKPNCSTCDVVYRRLLVDHVNQLHFELFDIDLDTVDTETISVALHLKSP